MIDGLLIVGVVLAFAAVLWYMVYLAYTHRVEEEFELRSSLTYDFEEEGTFEDETHGKSSGSI